MLIGMSLNIMYTKAYIPYAILYYRLRIERDENIQIKDFIRSHNYVTWYPFAQQHECFAFAIRYNIIFTRSQTRSHKRGQKQQQSQQNFSAPSEQQNHQHRRFNPAIVGARSSEHQTKARITCEAHVQWMLQRRRRRQATSSMRLAAAASMAP